MCNLEDWGVEGLVVIGGNGSQTGSHELSKARLARGRSRFDYRQ